jgi:hypothetical protein
VPGVRRLIRTYGPSATFTREAAIKIIGERDPEKPNASFGDHHHLFIEPRDTRTSLTPQMVFSYLVEKGVFRTGWDLKCPRCSLGDWTAIDQVRQQHVCGMCGATFDATRQLVESSMVFRRSGLLGIQKDVQGGVPVALTLQQLNNNLSRGTRSGLFLPSIDINDRSANPPLFCESDLCVIMPERFPDRAQVLIGECKDRDGAIDADDIAKLGRVADRLQASGLDAYILFAKLGLFSDAEIALAKSLNGPWQHRVIVLTDQELEP